MADKTSFELRAEEMLREGAKRLGPGDVVTMRPGYKVKVLTGFGAWDLEKRRLVCTGRVELHGTRRDGHQIPGEGRPEELRRSRVMDAQMDFEKLAEEAIAQGGRRVGAGETVVLSPSMKLTVLGGYAVVSLDGQIKVATGDITISRNAAPFRTFDDMVPSAGNGHPALSASMAGLLRTTGEYTNARATAGAELKAAGEAKLRAKTPAEREAAEAKVQAAWVAYENAQKAERLALATSEDPS